MGKANKLTPLSDYEETLIWMSYRYAIGRKTIHAHMHAGDIMSHSYERLKLTPDRMEFMSKDINRSIEDIMRFSDPIIYIDNPCQVNIFPVELYLTVISKEPNFNEKRIKYIHINVNETGDYLSHSIEYKKDDEPDNILIDKVHDLIVWNNVAKVFDMSKHHHAKLIDDSIVEYVDIINEYDNKTLKAPINRYINNIVSVSYIPDKSIKELID